MSYEKWSPLQLYLHFEALDGCVDDAWVEAIRIALDVEAIHALANAQTYLLASHDLSDHRPLPRWSGEELHFSEQEREVLESFFTEAVTERFLQCTLSSVAATGKITIDNPLGGDPVSSDLSISCGPIGFLRFSSGREPFYLLQHNFAVEALFFPLRRCVIGLQDCLSVNFKIRRFFLSLRNKPREWVDYYTRPSREWKGIYFGNESPYHFFYFQLPGLYASFVRNGATAPAFHSTAAEFYLNIPEVFSIAGAMSVHATDRSLESELFAEGGFVFSLGLRPYVWRRLTLLRPMDAALTSYCRALHIGELGRIEAVADFVLWGAVSSSKRAWIEESEALVMVVNELAPEFRHVILILDGWTSTLAKAAPVELCTAEELVVEDIRRRVHSNVECLSLVGETPVRKAALAGVVDYFVVGHATPSMYVARMAARPGVSHSSNAARATAIANHLHADTSLVPSTYVMDIDAGQGDIGRVSYHMDPGDFMRFAVSEFRKLRQN